MNTLIELTSDTNDYINRSEGAYKVWMEHCGNLDPEFNIFFKSRLFQLSELVLYVAVKKAHINVINGEMSVKLLLYYLYLLFSVVLNDAPFFYI